MTERGDGSAAPEEAGLLAQLVRIDSTDPGAYEDQIERFVRVWLEKRIRQAAGSDARGRELLSSGVSLEELEVLPGRRCLRALLRSAGEATDAPAQPMASMAGASTCPADLTLLCHMDTVVLGEGWDEEIDPLGGMVRDGRLYGRGSCDMKGGLACALLAFGDALDAAVARGSLPQRSLALVCTVDEEDVMRGSEAAIRAGWLGAQGWVMDLEPTGGALRMAHKGRTWFELTMTGVTAHASTPWEGADAIAGMAEAIRTVRLEVEDLPEDKELGLSTVTFGQVKGGYSPYVVPDSCTVTIDMRLVPPANTLLAQKIVQHAIDQAAQEVPGVAGSYRITGDRPPIPSNLQSGLVAAVQEAVREVTGGPAPVDVFTGYTDTAVVAGLCGNGDCLSYGPGSLELAHKPNEYVPLADLARVRRVLTRLACA